MKTFTTFGFVLGFYLFLGLALATPGQAEEHYIYKGPRGNLVISNQAPRTGSNVLRKLKLTEATDPQSQQPQEGSEPQLYGRSEGSPTPSKNK